MLASTVFVVPLLTMLSGTVQAIDVTTCDGFPTSPLDPPGPPTIQTSKNNSFTVQPNGCVRSQTVDGILLDNAGTSVTVASGNTKGPAAVAVSTVSSIVAIRVTQPGTITIGTGINTGVTHQAGTAILADAALTLNNAGFIRGFSSAIDLTAKAANSTITNTSTGFIAPISAGAQTQATIRVAADKLNLNNAGLIQSGNNQNAIELNTGATNATIINSSNKGIDSATLLGKNAIFVNEKNANITNTSTGLITGNVSAIAVGLGGASLSLTNQGTISSINGDTILLNEDDSSVVNGVTKIVNAAGAKISAMSGGGAALRINTTSTPGIILDVENSGTIEAKTTTLGPGAIAIGPSGFTGIINNLSGGNITGTGESAITVIGGATPPAGIIQNAPGGTISSNVNTIVLGGNLDSIVNAGTITATAGNAAILDSTLVGPAVFSEGIVNTGSIINTGAQTQFNNNQTITEVAIDLSNNQATAIGLFQGGNGTIIGLVRLAANGGENPTDPVFTMTGGSIIGTVFTSSKATNPSIVNLSGGTINYSKNPVSLNLANSTGTNIVNISDGFVMNGILANGGANTYNVSGGTFTALQEVSGSGSKMNVLAPFTFQANGPGNVISQLDTINVKSGGNFTVNTTNNNITPAIQDLMNLNIDANGTLTLNANIGLVTVPGTTIDINGTLNILNGPIPWPAQDWTFDAGTGTTTNNGVLNIDTHALLKTATYIQNPGGSFVVGIGGNNGPITNQGISGQIATASGTNLQKGSTVVPVINLAQFIPDNTFFDIVTTAAGLPIDNSTLVQPDSALVFFVKSVVAGPSATCTATGGCVVLTAFTRPFPEVVTCPNAQGIANTLEVLNQGMGPDNPVLLNLLAQLQTQTVDTITSAVEQLLPQINGVWSNAAAKSFDFAFASIQRRLEDLRGLSEWETAGISVTRDGPYGYSYGDGSDYASPVSTWLYGAGSYADQKGIGCASGYWGDAATLAIGSDWAILDGGSRVGFVLNQTNTHNVNKNPTHSVLNSRSTQGTVYVWFDPMESVYSDVAVGFAVHDFEGRRNISIGNINLAIMSNFSAVEYGAQWDLGYAFLYENAVVAPVMRARYTHLEPESFTESGGDGIDLNTRYLSKNEFLLGVGFRAAARMGNEQVMYAPEISFMYFRELYNNLERAESNFTGGGIDFPSVQNRFERNRYVWGLGLNTHSSDKYILTLRYEMDIRDHYVGNTGSVQLVHYWG